MVEAELVEVEAEVISCSALNRVKRNKAKSSGRY